MPDFLRLHLRPAKLFHAAMLLIGVYATLRYGSEWTYSLGKIVGAS